MLKGLFYWGAYPKPLLTDSIIFVFVLLFASIDMPAPNDGSNGNKRPADDMEPEIAVLRAFLENRFPVWVQRIPGDSLACRVAEVSLRCQKQGKHIPTFTEGMAAILNNAIQADRVLDLVVAWEDVS